MEAKAGVVSFAEAQTRDWQAWLNLMPPPPDDIHVIGNVKVANPGISPMLVMKEPQGINPAILILELYLRQEPGVWPQVVVWKQVRYDAVVRGAAYSEVTILAGADAIANIPVETVR